MTTNTKEIEIVLASSHSMLTVVELQRITGLDRKGVEAQLKILGQQGQIDHRPKSGRFEAAYGLLRTTPQAPAVVTHNPHTGEPRDERDIASDPSGILIVAPGEPLRAAHADEDSEGGETDVQAAPAPSGTAEESVTNLLNGFDATKLPPILISCVARLWPGTHGMFWEQFLERMPDRINELKKAIQNGEAAERDRDAAAFARDAWRNLASSYKCDTPEELAKLLAGYRDAADEKLRAKNDELHAINAESANLLTSAADEIENLTAERDAARRLNAEMHADLHEIREALLPFWPDAILAEPTAIALAKHVAAELTNARALASKLEHLLGAERTACAALREQLDHVAHGGSPIDPRIDGIDSFAVVAPKRPMRRFMAHENAVKSAMSAARNGSGRGEVFALVPIGRAVRGAEWRPAK